MNKKIVIGIAIIIALAIGVILFFVFSSEKQPVGNPPTVEGQDYFNARVTSVNDKYILAECMENDSGAIKVGTELSISCNTVSSEEFPDLVVGDYIRVVYAGAILEKNPPSFQQIISVFKINEEGAVLQMESYPLEVTNTVDMQ